MIKVIERQIRRLGVFSFGMASMFLAVVARTLMGMTQVGHLVFFFGALVAFVIVGVALIKARPCQRGVLEIAGVSGIISTICLIYLPHAGLLTPFVALAIFFAVLTSIWFFLHSEMSRRIGARTTWRTRFSGDLQYPAKLVWKHMIPGAASPADHCTGQIDRYIEDIDDEDTLHVALRPSRMGQANYDITFLDRNAPTFCRFYFEGNEADGTLVDGIFSLSVDVRDRGDCTIIINEERSGLSLGSLIERWFDDALSFQHDRLIALLDKRYGPGAGISKPLSQEA